MELDSDKNLDMNETQTRAELIDPALIAAGWSKVEGSRIKREHSITQGRKLGNGKRTKPLSADYVLIYKNRILAVVEAKADTKYYTDGVGQAKDYADRLNVRYTYSTNGRQIYWMDMEAGNEKEVFKYPSPEELWEMTFPTPKTAKAIAISDWKERLFKTPFEDRGGTWQPRYYQENAITKVLEAIAEGKDRLLLTLATGTGKTAIAFQIAWKLFHAKWNLQRDGNRLPRILFLADRNILADQAFNSFNAFDEDALVRISATEISKDIKKGKKNAIPKNGSIFFTIFQSFISDHEEVPHYESYDKDFFDLIIIDECHRGGANDESSWRDIMEYFSPAVQLGLTATPKRDVNADTYKYFDDPIYIYSLKQGINDGFLTPFKVKEIQTNYDEYTFTKDDIILDGEAEVGDTFTYRDYGRKIIIQQVEEYRVKKFLSMMNQNHKTLVFCATQKHAAMIRDLINQFSDSTNPFYCQRVTADDGSMGEQHLRDFQDNEKIIPTILTTSQKLSTGVDAPELRNVVLLRPVNSMVEFKQIVGRGTRLFEDKEYFTIYDFVKAHEHFNDDEWDGPPLPPDDPKPYPTPKVCKICGLESCGCVKEPQEACDKCGYIDCICEEEPTQKMVRIQLSANKALELDSTVKTSFWSPDGTPISAAEFIKMLYGDLPSFFKTEDELRQLWSMPSTRKKLFEELEEKGYSTAQLDDLRKIVHGEQSDIFDVLAHIAYQKNMIPRLNRAERAKIYMNDYNAAQQEFLNFVLEQYVKEGVMELDDTKLPDLLELKYQSIADAKDELGSVREIRELFIGFQGSLYGGQVG